MLWLLLLLCSARREDGVALDDDPLEEEEEGWVEAAPPAPVVVVVVAAFSAARVASRPSACSMGPAAGALRGDGDGKVQRIQAMDQRVIRNKRNGKDKRPRRT